MNQPTQDQINEAVAILKADHWEFQFARFGYPQNPHPAGYVWCRGIGEVFTMNDETVWNLPTVQQVTRS